jgi:CubicO group peptidase (beta-lactamase class C family)
MHPRFHPMATALLLATALQVPASVNAQNEASVDPAIAAQIDSIFAPFDDTTSPGCAVAVVRGGVVALSSGYGMASLEHDVPITPATRFYAASVSKQFAAFAIALLVGDGRVSLDDDVRRWIPEVPDFGATITVRHLVHHTSGLRDYFGLLGLTGWPSDGPLTAAAFLDLVSRQRALNFAPGSEHLYSNTGYVLLAVLVERVTGQTLRDFAEARIFRPLGMQNSAFRDDHTQPVRGRAQAYVRTSSGGWRISEPGFDVVGDGGLYTTVEDLARWAANFDNLTVGDAALSERIHTRGILNDGTEIGYAFGLSIGERRGQRIVQHGGAYGGYRTMFVRFPDAGLGVATLCNAGTANASLLALRVAVVVLGDRLGDAVAVAPAAAPMSAAAASTPVDPARLTDYVGTYHSDELDTDWRVSVHEGTLVVRRARLTEQRLTPAAEPDTFTAEGATLRFLRGADGRVSHFALSAGRIRDVRFDIR